MSHDDLRKRADGLESDLVRWRRTIHQQPELGYEKRKTAALVEARLRELDLEVTTGIAETGIVGLLRAPQPTGPAVLLRADMDALPIQEIEGREYGSQVAGKMHACGHDGHTSMLLGAATILAGQRERLVRDVLFCFQPAEEGGAGGERMVQEGALDIVETGTVYGLHLWSPLEVGHASITPGPAMAAVDEFHARIVGRGGHGAMPHCNIDPIVAAASAVSALQSVVARNVDPLKSAVVTVGCLQAGTTTNVIPDDAKLKGTMRSFDTDVRELLRRRVPEVLSTVAEAHGCTLEFELVCGYPATVNDPVASELARGLANHVFGAENVHQPPPMACSEDFSYFLEQRPGAFIMVGAGNASRGITAPHHSPEFDIDEAALPRGAELLARLALAENQPG